MSSLNDHGETVTDLLGAAALAADGEHTVLDPGLRGADVAAALAEVVGNVGGGVVNRRGSDGVVGGDVLRDGADDGGRCEGLQRRRSFLILNRD